MNMNTLKDIFVSYEIAEKLKEIGFDIKCIAYYYDDKELHLFEEKFKITTDNEFNKFVIAPTYEQVFKWFREKGYYSEVAHTFGDFYGNVENIKSIELYNTDSNFKTYEQAREQLILKLIEIYKNEQNNERKIQHKKE